jgi:hypothetical protein
VNGGNSAVPMRGPLPLRKSPPDVPASLRHAVRLLLESPDFTAIVAFAGGGFVTSLKLALAYPVVLEAVALFAQTG